MHNYWVLLLVMAITTYLIRSLPFAAFGFRIKSRFVRDFLYYVPYVTLAVMTFPDIIQSTSTPVSGLLALFSGVALAWSGKSLFTVAVVSCAVVFVSELILL